MTERTERAESVFVVRIWREAGRATDGAWRGCVDHVSAGRRIYFSDFSDLTDFLRLGLAQNPGNARREAAEESR